MPIDRPMASNPAPQPDVKISIEDFTDSAELSIPVAGLLASDPKLATAKKTRARWQQLLDEYAKTPRP